MDIELCHPVRTQGLALENRVLYLPHNESDGKEERRSYIRSEGSRMRPRANTKATRTNDLRIFEAKEAECNLVRTQRLHVLMLVFLFPEDGLG